jgi:hypothetical protein
MALTKGNVTSDRRIPAASSYTISHNQNTGANGYLFVTVACPATTVTSVTYNGVSMTLVQRNATGYSTDWSVWGLASPSTGANNVIVTMAGANYNGVSTFITSFLDCAGVGNIAYNGSALNPVTTSITISANSMILGSIIGGNSTNAYIGLPQGSNRTLEYNDNINNYTWGAVSPSLTAGSKTCEGGSTATNIIMVTEIKEVVAIVTSTQGMMMMMF